MKKTLLVLAIASLAALPAKAETAFWFTCDFDGGAELQTTSFGLFASTNDGLLTYDPDEEPIEITWTEIGGVTHIFSANSWPSLWLLSFDPEAQEAIGFADLHLVPSTSCRGGAE